MSELTYRVEVVPYPLSGSVTGWRAIVTCRESGQRVHETRVVLGRDAAKADGFSWLARKRAAENSVVAKLEG